MLSNANEQIKRLNGLLMEKESELRSVHEERSSNASFTSHNRTIEKISNLTFRDYPKNETMEEEKERWRNKGVIRTKI